MKKTLVLLLTSSACFLIVSCGGKAITKKELSEEAMSQVKFIYEEHAVRLHLKADPQLNLFQGRPHTLSMCIYQLSDPNSFSQLTGDQEGLYQLLECNRFDASVATARSLSIQPGQERDESLDRAEGARYIAVVAGYFTLQKEHIVRLFEVPILQKRKWYNPLSKSYELGIFSINLLLGPQEIQELGGRK